MAWFDPNSLFRIMSANRAGTLPNPSQGTTTSTSNTASVATATKNPNMYLTLGGAGATLTMQPLAASNGTGGVDPKQQLWMFRPAIGTQQPGYWNIYSLSAGEDVCLQRADTSTGALVMGPFAANLPAQKWYIETVLVGSVSASTIKDRTPTTENIDGSRFPVKLDVKTRSDVVQAKLTKTSLLDDRGVPINEDTKWDIQFARTIIWKETKKTPT